jgi:hypothetical protein
MEVGIALTAALSVALSVHAQQDTPQVEARVNAILTQMTLAEKLDYISGEPFGRPEGVFNIKPDFPPFESAVKLGHTAALMSAENKI